jgi:hypothetical protein
MNGFRDDTYLIQRIEWDEYDKHWDAWIEERANDETDIVVFAWQFRDCATPFEALEVVTNEYVRMMSNTIGYYLSQE